MEEQQVNDQWINEKRLAEITDLSVFTLRRWRFEGVGFPYSKISNRAVRYKLSDIMNFLEDRKVEPKN